MIVFYMIVGLLLLLAATAGCVAHHESYGASLGRSECWLCQFGHWDAVMLEDGIAAIALVAAAAIVWSLERNQAASIQTTRVSWKRRLAEITAGLLLTGVGVLMGFEALGEVTILQTEDQRVFDGLGMFTRVAAYVGTLLVACGGFLLGLHLLFYHLGEEPVGERSIA